MKKIQIVLILIIFFAKSNSNSQQFSLDWINTFGSPHDDYCNSIAVDASGNVYSTGVFSDTVDFDPGPASQVLISKGSYDFFIQKCDANGNLLWAYSFGNSAIDRGHSIWIDHNAYIYITGIYSGTIDFDPGSGITTLTSSGVKDVFLLKLDLNGNFIWAKSFGGNTDNEQGYGVSTDVNRNVYVVGSFLSNIFDADPGPDTSNLYNNGIEDIFFLSLNESGGFRWAKAIGSNNIDVGRTVVADNFGSVYFGGYFSATADLNPDSGTYMVTSYGAYDAFVEKLDTSGNYMWSKRFGGTSFDMIDNLIIGNSQNVYAVGEFDGVSDFDPDTSSFFLNTHGALDAFVIKINPLGNLIWVKNVGDVTDDYGSGIVSDASENLYVTGTFCLSPDFNADTGSFILNSNGSRDAYLSLLDSSGKFITAVNFGGNGEDWSRTVSISSNGNIYLAGYFSDTVDFDPGVALQNRVSAGMLDYFLLKFNYSPVAINEVNNDNFNVFPNPFIKSFNVELNQFYEKVHSEIYDLMANRILNTDFKNVHQLNFDFNFSKGIYILKIDTENKHFIRKLIQM